MKTPKFEQYLTEHGISETSIKKFGIHETKSEKYGLQVAFPIKDSKGVIIFHKYRNLDHVEGGEIPKFVYDPGTSAQLYNYHAIKDSEYAFLFEGEPDVIRASEDGIPAVCGTSGAGTFDKAWEEKLIGKKVLICYDNDQAGEVGAKKVLDFIPEALQIKLPDGVKDYCEYRKKYSVADFQELASDVIKVNTLQPHKEIISADLEIIQIFGFQVDLNDTKVISLSKDSLNYKIKNLKDYKADLAVYYKSELCNRESLSLISGSNRSAFVKKCAGLEEEVKNTITADLIKIPEVLDEFDRQQFNRKDEFEQPTEGDITAAKKLMLAPIPLFDILQIIKKIGVVGEEQNALAHYLTLTSRLLDSPLSEVVKGESAAGKSYPIIIELQLFPNDAYRDITDATPQSFYYAPKDYFAHKIIIIFEKHGQDKADYSIRSFQSEKKLKIQVTVKDPDTGLFATKEITVDGPVGFITTTTDARIHNENETRNISLYPDESVAQTERIFDVLNARYRGSSAVSDEEIKDWQNVQRLLKSYPIIIPFVDELGKIFPKKPIRVRRDYEKFLAVITAITLFHQDQREKNIVGETEYLVSTLADFYIAKVLFEGIFQKTIFELSPKSQEVIEAAKEIVDEVIDKLTIRDLADKLGWNYDTAKKWFDPAFQQGYFTLVDEHRGSKGATYKPTDKKISDKPILPNVEDLYEINPDWLGDSTIYNPLTGAVLKLQEREITTDIPILKEQGQDEIGQLGVEE